MTKSTEEKSTTSASSTSPSITSNNDEVAVTVDSSVPFIPASLTVTNLQYEVTIKEPLKDGEKKSLFKKVPNVQRALLSNIAIKATPGRVFAIMGPSGSGKTTLLDLLSDRQIRNTGKLQGEISLNDVPIKEYGSMRKRLLGYVTQEDGKLAPRVHHDYR